MPTTLAQAVTPNPGASNAADFQPSTQNPQTAPGQLFTQPGGLQSGDQQQLLENSNVQISVPSNPAPAQPAVTEAKSGGGAVVIAVLIAAVIIAFLMWRRRRQPAVVPLDLEVPEAAVEEVKTAIAKPPRPKAKTKKPAPRKSKSQRKKKARR